MSRSEFFATAARRYLDELDSQSVTAKIDDVLSAAAPDGSSAAAVAAGRTRLFGETDW